jgi:eukaryotic-like serine/threonine-protein kinase
MSKRSSPLWMAAFLLACLLLSGCGSPATASPTAAPTAVPTIPPSPTATPPPAGTVLWTFQAGDSIWSTPTISNGRIYFGSDDQSLYAVDLQTHQLVWKFAASGIIRSRPAVLDNVIYASSDDGVLHALDAATGVEKWQVNIGSGNARSGGPFDVGSGYDYKQSSPAIAEGVIYVGSGAGELDAVEAATGKQLWSFKTGGRVRSTPVVADGKVYVGDGNGSLHALDAKTGAELWSQPGCDVPSPAVSGGSVYCGGRGTFEVRAWDVLTGELRWQFPIGHSWVDSSPVIDGGSLYNGSSDASTLFALDPATGAQKWSFATKGYAWCTPTAAGDKVYMGSYNMGVEGNFYAVEAATGQPAWSLTVKGGIVGSAVVDQGVVYFPALDGSLYAVQE